MSDESKESKLRAQADRGEIARLVLKELEGAFDALEKDCFDSFRRSDVHDSAGHMALRQYLMVLEDVRGRFKTAVVTGEAARKALLKP